MSVLTGKTVLVTGGTGSFGRAFIRIALTHEPEAIRIFSRGEYLQWEMLNQFNDNRLRFFIGDVRDRNRLQRATDGVDIVVHAAALKQVPTCEYNPVEAVATNVLGAVNVLECAIDQNVDKVIAISTDKACQAVNLYGATKAVMERLFVQANSYSGKHKTKFSCVRYGNVSNSRGSVLPLFREQAKSGSITITDTRMSRFWLTLEKGVDFVLQSLEEMQGGEIFIPKLPSVLVTDIASAVESTVEPTVSRVVIGTRPGEKIHEMLITAEEARHSVGFDNHYVILPEHSFWKTRLFSGEPLPEGFQYSSDTNKEWLSSEDLRKMLI